jgi:outer membrane protein OmpA-like peptidoglycan-associated protein
MGFGLLAVSVLVAGILGATALPSNAAQGGGVSISGDAPGGLYPGSAAQSIDLAFSNPNDDLVSFSGLTVSIGAVDAPHRTVALPCTAADYAVTQFSGSSPLPLPSGSTTLTSLGYATSTWPTIRMLETGTNQNGCAGATVILNYSGSGQDGPATTTTTTTPATTPVTATTTNAPAATTTTTTAAGTTTSTSPFTPPSTTVKKPSLTITPTTQTVASGGKAHFTIHVKNTAGVKLTGVAVADRAAPNCSRSLGTMAAGASKTYTCSRSGVKAAFTDIATLSGKTPTGPIVSLSTSAKVRLKAPFTPPPHVALKIRMRPVKQTVVVKIAQGDAANGAKPSASYPTAHFTITVTNSGNVALKAVTVRDRLAKRCGRALGKLAAGHSRTFQCTRSEVMAGFTNVATVSGKAANGKNATARTHTKVEVKTSRGASVTKTSTGVTVTQSKSGATVTLSLTDVLFAFNESTLGPRANRPLMTVLRYVTKAYQGHLTVTGYTDDIGSTEYNLELSHRRAATVALWLEQHGVPTSRITIAWKGEDDPIASNATAEGRQKNRRVTITVRRAKG